MPTNYYTYTLSINNAMKELDASFYLDSHIKVPEACWCENCKLSTSPNVSSGKKNIDNLFKL